MKILHQYLYSLKQNLKMKEMSNSLFEKYIDYDDKKVIRIIRKILIIYSRSYKKLLLNKYELYCKDKEEFLFIVLISVKLFDNSSSFDNSIVRKRNKKIILIFIFKYDFFIKYLFKIFLFYILFYNKYK